MVQEIKVKSKTEWLVSDVTLSALPKNLVTGEQSEDLIPEKRWYEKRSALLEGLTDKSMENRSGAGKNRILG